MVWWHIGKHKAEQRREYEGLTGNTAAQPDECRCDAATWGAATAQIFWMR